ncbi:hypothetical protein BaRGS_00012998 [Batillaria attramentaria]|uniref:Uncharacterized protein n=1 Tax=Batillaria attramentaria TaxID=370345 RepID=A0ABD0L9C1_9CAEN
MLVGNSIIHLSQQTKALANEKKRKPEMFKSKLLLANSLMQLLPSNTCGLTQLPEYNQTDRKKTRVKLVRITKETLSLTENKSTVARAQFMPTYSAV